ncbi:hypothetical protein TMEN_9801 [Trichophyton mentagrophytes]|uniref:Mitochondrial integral membrane protein n=2 Tax=Trichophyton interdigitale TaxID=101480 RepID=A0A9P4YFE7_9EURO|nr:hypothetical protein H101_02366 [Trichophyton interdigitale H6]KAF3891857.1 Mitochondrial integral membrane protein [Trichophyton interdigitale]KDB26446.1 hypothetical protein H109_01754 [Trichophyton interdigitale MR816]GBF67078.1 hypothetical protein TMEN_9801 [Trichophyton mentagrophytes]KAF3892850.1 Mitochondrial integral membrane protein [Trichophyton interdigitale]
MSPLWGLRHNGREEGRGDGDEEEYVGETGRPDNRRRAQDVDERTRLLPAEGNGYLHPDDPAVSPYNLWSVRALRGLTLTVLFISLLWWILLLISIFVSPPGMSNRGSGFFDFSFTTLTISNLLIALIFFAIPSTPMTIWATTLSILLSVSLFLMLGVPRLRIEEGWVGIASAAWAVIISLYLVAQTRLVAQGKRQEEERLTGREETRRSLSEWLAILVQIVVMAVTVLVGILLMSTLSLRAKDATLDPPGQRYYVDSNKYQVHLHCIGGDHSTLKNSNETAVTVLLEGGEAPVEYTFQKWVDEAYQHGVIKRYCYWDRPGIAWSDNAPSPHSAGMSADALSEALAMADEEGPWVVVSAGVGGIYSRIFASRHLRDIHGIMLIDTLHEDLLHNLGKPGRGLMLWVWGILSPLGIDRLAGAIFKGRTRVDRVCGMRAYQGGKFIKAELQESLVADSITRSEISSARHIQSPSTPLVVVSSGKEVRRSQTWADKQEDLTKITKNLVAWDVVKGAPHQVWDTLDGRRTLEKRLGELVKQAKH